MTSNSVQPTGTNEGDRIGTSAEAPSSLTDEELLHWVTVGAVGSAVFLTDASGGFVFIGPDVERILGYTESEFRAMGDIYAFLGRDMPRAGEVEEAGLIAGLEHTISVKSGESRRLLIDISSVDLAGGRLLFVCRDITDRWKAQNELVQHQRTLQTILDGLPDIVALQMPDHTIIAYNETGYRLLGVTPEQLAGRKCFELIGRDKPCRRCATRRAQQSGRTESTEKYLPEMGAWIRVCSIPIIGLNGEVSMMVEQITDISDQKSVEESLRRSEELLNETGDLARRGRLGSRSVNESRVLDPDHRQTARNGRGIRTHSGRSCRLLRSRGSAPGPGGRAAGRR
jgi:PAS domain S-box-containing protein